MSMFKRRTSLDIINDQISETKKKLLENQHTADHYAALAEGNLKTLNRLLAARAEETKDTVVIRGRQVKLPPAPPKPVEVPVAKVKLASAK